MRSRPRLLRATLAAALPLAIGGCFLNDTTAPNPNAVMRQFLRDLVTVMEQNSYRRDSVDWAVLRGEVMEAGQYALTWSETYPAVRIALEGLGDNHSWFQVLDGSLLPYTKAISCIAPNAATLTDLPADIGYVRVRQFSGTAEEMALYAEEIRTQFLSRDTDQIVGWIVDLRGNGGGNMWPMLAALSPLLDGSAGFFVDADSIWQEWWVHEGTSFLDQFPVATVDVHVPHGVAGRVAVLTDVRVASSGEATAIAFKKRPDTRQFGVGTCGVSTGIQVGDIGPGFVLGLATTVMADRDSTIYGGKVLPDEEITDTATLVARAIEWIRSGI